MPTYAAGRNRPQAVASLTSAAYSVLEARGHIQFGLHLSSYKARLEGLTIQVHPPFYVKLGPYWQRLYLDHLRADPESLPFHLNILAPNNVLHVTWFGTKFGIVSFRRGSWEKTLLDAARAVDHDQAISPMVLPAQSGSQH
jgi:hypothetical protein